MPLHAELPGPDRDRSRKVRPSHEGDVRPSSRRGGRVLAHGALVCPACNLPLAPGRPLGVGEHVRCSYCLGTAPALDYLAVDVIDTRANEVYVVARHPVAPAGGRG